LTSFAGLADGQQLYFTGADPHPRGETPPYDGSTQVWRIGAIEATPVPVTRVPDGLAHFVLGPKGDFLIYTTTEEVVDDEWKGLRTEFEELEYGHGVCDKHNIWRLDLQSWRHQEIRRADTMLRSRTTALLWWRSLPHRPRWATSIA